MLLSREQEALQEQMDCAEDAQLPQTAAEITVRQYKPYRPSLAINSPTASPAQPYSLAEPAAARDGEVSYADADEDADLDLDAEQQQGELRMRAPGALPSPTGLRAVVSSPLSLLPPRAGIAAAGESVEDGAGGSNGSRAMPLEASLTSDSMFIH